MYFLLLQCENASLRGEYIIASRIHAMAIDVCPTCFKFLQTIYDRKKMKEVRLAPDQPCKSMYHKKLTDSFKS